YVPVVSPGGRTISGGGGGTVHLYSAVGITWRRKGRDDVNQDARHAQFMERIERGEKIEATDWMPDEYRKLLLKLIHMHGVSEIMGAFPEKEWVPKAPTLKRKLAIMAKVQDEMGHGQLLLRVAEDLAAPLGKGREELLDDLLAGRVKFHNVF